MKKLLLLTSVTTLLFQAQAFAVEAKVELENYLNNIKTYEAEFEQVLVSEKDVLQESSKGKFFLARPGKFLWEYSMPYEQSIIADGKNIWIYDKDLEQATVREMTEILADSPALLLSNEVAISEEFVVTKMPANEAKQGQEWFLLKPKNQDKQYADIRLAFMDSNLKEMELRDNFGQLTWIRFSNPKSNAVIDMNIFNFTPPEGVDVLNTLTE